MAESRLDVIVRTRGQDQLEKLHRTTQDTEKQLGKLGGRLRDSQGRFVATGKAAGAAASGIRGAGEAAKRSTAEVGKLDKALDGLRQGATALKAGLAGLAVGAFFKTIIGAAADIERVQKRLETLTGSAQTAKAVYEDLQRVNKQSPFELEDLAGAAAKLSAYGVETEKLVTTTERLGKISAATQSDIEGIALAYGQVRVKGRLQGEELLQFAERGIPLQAELARMLGKSGEEISDLVSKGRIGFPLVEKAIENLTGETGQFGKAFENTANSIDAKLSNLQDAFKRAAAALGKAFEPIFKWMVEQLTGILELVEGAISRWQGVSSLTPERVSSLQQQAQQETDKKFGFFDFGNKSEYYNKRFNELVDVELKKVAGAVGKTATTAKFGAPPSPGEVAKYNAMLTGGTRPGGATGGRGAGTTSRAAQGLQGRYIQGGYGPGGPNQYGAHFDIKRVDGSYFDRAALDKYVRVNGAALSSGLTVPGGQFGASRDGGARTHRAWDYAFGGRAALSLTGGAKWQSVSGGSYGDTAVFMTPDGKAYRIIHGKFEKEGGGDSTADRLNDQMEALLEEQKAREESLAAGSKLIQQEDRRLQLLRAGGEYEKELLQIRFDQEDRLAEIAQLQDASQREKLTTLVNQSAELERQLALTNEIQRRVSEPTVFQQQKAEPGKLQSYIDQTRTNLADIQGQVVQVAQTLEGGLANGMTNAVSAIVQGTGNIKKAFSDMFLSIGQSFVQMATQMLSQRLILGLLGGLGGMFGGGGSPFGISPIGGGLFGGGSLGMIGFSGGGYTGDAPRSGGVDGQGGFPAILHPQETVIDHSALRGGMSSGGKRDTAAPQISLNVTATKIGDQDFVKVDDLRRAMAETRKQAAVDGEARVMSKLQNSPRTRSKIGLR